MCHVIAMTCNIYWSDIQTTQTSQGHVLEERTCWQCTQRTFMWIRTWTIRFGKLRRCTFLQIHWYEMLKCSCLYLYCAQPELDCQLGGRTPASFTVEGKEEERNVSDPHTIIGYYYHRCFCSGVPQV